jgi:hypothetical protein
MAYDGRRATRSLPPWICIHFTRACGCPIPTRPLRALVERSQTAMSARRSTPSSRLQPTGKRQVVLGRAALDVTLGTGALVSLRSPDCREPAAAIQQGAAIVSVATRPVQRARSCPRRAAVSCARRERERTRCTAAKCSRFAAPSGRRQNSKAPSVATERPGPSICRSF